MTQNIYDDPAFFEGYSKLGRSVQGLAGAAEWPALMALLPPTRRLRVVDLGCGYGWFCRWAREQGAAAVLGLDVSEKMLDRARSSSADPAITYAKADLEKLDLQEASFDLAYSSLAFHYIEDLRGLLQNIHRALVPGARLVFSIEHPIYMAPQKPGWLIDESGRKTWPVDSYQQEGRADHQLAGRWRGQAAPDDGHTIEQSDWCGLYDCPRAGMGSDRRRGCRTARTGRGA
ncbi:SAM-dependent methyltransferase [Caballeronia udeis]|uniref:SAM-dependent methyltransferase n=1 Tax=Caballeronia udeis TaxID=1232866 RepID=A0ABW8MI29_9BURK